MPNPLSTAERYDVLSKACNEFSFDGSTESNRELKALTLATQFHKCNNYCSGTEGSCRFLFPFPLQRRGSVSMRISTSGQKRFIALAPRTSPHVNSTHPMLTAMNHSNTDVTVIIGNSIPEAMYACSYAVKADKNPLFDIQCLRRVQQFCNASDDRKLLGSIARNSAGSRSVGAQEAVNYLLENPLSFCSASVKNINTFFLLNHPKALSQDQKARNLACEQAQSSGIDILPQLDIDRTAAVPSWHNFHNHYAHALTSDQADPYICNYIRRPRSLDNLSASQFYESYIVKNVDISRRIPRNQSMILLDMSNGDKEILGSLQADGIQVAQKRRVRKKSVEVDRFINIPSRGIASDESPQFAAAALTLHVPFRTIEGLLGGLTLTEKLKQLLDSEKYPLLNRYVSHSYDLATALSCPPPRFSEGRVQGKDSNQEDIRGTECADVYDSDEEHLASNPYALTYLNSSMFEEDFQNPYDVQKQWSGLAQKKFSGSNFKETLQLERFRSYLKDCRTVGTTQAEKNLCSEMNHSMNCDLDTSGNLELYDDDAQRITSLAASHDLRSILDFRNILISETRTSEQNVWLDMVLSYLSVYYCQTPFSVPPSLKRLCQDNHPIFTNAPGGCGKSWLLRQVDRFVSKCIPCGSQPVWALVSEKSPNPLDSDIYSISNPLSATPRQSGRLGRVAIFAPSGVAAGNSNGFTFHNGLRSSIITSKSLQSGPSEDLILRLSHDFSGVSVIVIEEYSMVSITLMAYLDLVARKVRPAYADKFFGGIVVIITGEGLQLPVINSYGLLSNPQKIPAGLRDLHKHLTMGVFFLKLSESVRQGKDLKYANLLQRIRTAVCTKQDAEVLNTRYVRNFRKHCKNYPQWSTAPILTARNHTVNALNSQAISQNGKRYGTFHIYNMPLLTKAKSIDSRRKTAKSFFKNRTSFKLASRSEKFEPPPLLITYPGMPVMLRTNICPSIGLSNGSIGRVWSIISTCRMQPHEREEEVIERCVNGDNSIPSLLVQFPESYRGKIGAVSGDQSTMTSGEARSTVLIEPQVIGRVRGLPIVPAHALTMHKSQSLTLPYTVIDPRETFCMGALYVAFSRSPSLERVS